jgi:spoIIIJ-associated protein
LIGRRSETLNAFQYIASLIVGKEVQDWVQLVIDVEGYRERREKQLIQMAKRMADQVAKSGRRQTLEPMPSAERRIIHIALRDHPDVLTESTGEDPHRKVTIVPKNN